MSAITAKASRKMKKYAVLTREPRCFLGSFDFSWEQRKAKEICSIGTGKSNTQDQVDDGKYPFYIRSDVPVRSNKYLYDCEAVITIGDGNIGKVFHYVNGKFDLHQRCYKMTDFKDIWGKYFFYYFSTNDLQTTHPEIASEWSEKNLPLKPDEVNAMLKNQYGKESG
ncbi:restriction endonuclease subunit S [Ruminococcus sp.]|uniref:restriction endonuclease subunit S n=1 Tax=Ruminococcus sp. TaxID=41978 RepID=UPI003AB776EE